MVCFTKGSAVVAWVMSPWQVAQAILARACGAC
jgi:hypothetical protein